MPLTIRVSEHSQSTGSDRTPSDHTDDEEFSGVPVDSLSTGSLVDEDSDGDIGDEFVHIRRVRSRRTTYEPADDIDPSDSASRPGTSRQSSQQRGPRGPPGRASSRRNNPAPEPPPPRRPSRGPPLRIPRDPARGRPPRPESFHSDSLEQDDYPYGPPGGLPYRPGPASGWNHVPRYGGYGDPSVVSAPHDAFARQDVMSYRDPYYDNPFTPQAGGFDDYFEMPPPRRPRPQVRHSMGPPPRDYSLMPYRDPYYDPFRDPYGYPRRESAPPKPPTPAAAPVTPGPLPTPSPADMRLAKLEALILAQTEQSKQRAAEKAALRDEEERKKKYAEEKTQSEKLIALEKLLLKQNEEAIAREKATEAKIKSAEASAAAKAAKEAAEKAATEKIAKELKEAADAAKKAAEAEAEKKAKEAKEAADKELAAMKEKHEAAEAAKKKAEEEAKALKPSAPPPPIRFKDAVGRKFQFPYEICKEWKGMEGLIKQAFLHVDLLGPHVLEGHYDLIGPDGEIILPQVWGTMIKPDYAIEMQMWPIPELEKGKNKGKGPPEGGFPGLGGGHGGMPDFDALLKGLGPPPKGAHGHGHGGHGGGLFGKPEKGKKGGKVNLPAGIPPPPHIPGVIPAPPGGPIGAMPGGIPPPPGGPIPGFMGGMGGMGMRGMEGGGPPPDALARLMADAAKAEKKSKKNKEVPALARWMVGSGGGKSSGKGGKKPDVVPVGPAQTAMKRRSKSLAGGGSDHPFGH